VAWTGVCYIEANYIGKDKGSFWGFFWLGEGAG
jgi:hypothetical protein